MKLNIVHLHELQYVASNMDTLYISIERLTRIPGKVKNKKQKDGTAIIYLLSFWNDEVKNEYTVTYRQLYVNATIHN